MKKKIMAAILAAMCCTGTVSMSGISLSCMAEQTMETASAESPEGTRTMTMDDVLELSKKNDTIIVKWSDFTEFKVEDTSSDSAVWETEWTFKIDDEYTLKVCGKTERYPDHIYLSDNNKRRIDICTDDVRSFLNKGVGEDSLSISDEVKENFRVYEMYSDEFTKPERRLVKDFKSIMRYYNVPVRFVFSEYDNIDDILASAYATKKYYVVEQQDGTLQCYNEHLKEMKSNRQTIKNGETVNLSYLDIPEKAFERFDDPDFVKKYISPDVNIENVYYLSGESSHMGTAIYYRTDKGDYVYYNHYSIGEKLFPIEKFCKYPKAISAELAKNPNDNGGGDVDISGVMDLSEFELKETVVSENVNGDANCDGDVNMSDAVIIMQSLANPAKYGVNGTDENHITEQGKINGDIAGNNDGITNADALAIQKKLLGIKDDIEQPATIQTPPKNNSYLFDSYDDLAEALTKADSFKTADSDSYGELFNNTVSAFENKDITLYVPALNGKECELMNKEGFSNITLLTSELYNLPCIWYHCKADNSDIDIKLAYHSIIENDALNSAKTYYDILKLIAPEAPNPDNYTEFESYQKIYESKISLANDKNVDAMISEIKDSNKVYVMFNYDGMLVSIYADQNALTEEFWNSFSLKKV